MSMLWSACLFISPHRFVSCSFVYFFLGYTNDRKNNNNNNPADFRFVYTSVVHNLWVCMCVCVFTHHGTFFVRWIFRWFRDGNYFWFWNEMGYWVERDFPIYYIVPRWLCCIFNKIPHDYFIRLLQFRIWLPIFHASMPPKFSASSMIFIAYFASTKVFQFHDRFALNCIKQSKVLLQFLPFFRYANNIFNVISTTGSFWKHSQKFAKQILWFLGIQENSIQSCFLPLASKWNTTLKKCLWWMKLGIHCNKSLPRRYMGVVFVNSTFESDSNAIKSC